MTREGVAGGGGGGREEQGKVMGPLFPRLHVSDAGKAGGPRAPPRNKMALYEQFTVPSNRFSSSAASTRAAGGSLGASSSASQVYSYDRPLLQPFDAPSNGPAHSSEKLKGNSINGQSNSTRRESGRMSSQTKNNDVYALKSIAESTSQHRVHNINKNSSGKKLAIDDEFMVPSICSPRFSRYSTQVHAGVQDRSNPLSAINPHKSPSAMPKSSAECYSGVNRHLERIDESDMRSMNSSKAKEKESVQQSKNVEVEEKSSPVQAFKEKYKNKDAKASQMGDNTTNIDIYDNPLFGNKRRQPTSMNGSSMEAKNPTTRDTLPCKPCTDLNNNKNSNLLDRSLQEAGSKRKRGHHDVEQNDDLSDSSVECIPGGEVSPDEIVGAIGPKHFWKARRAIQNQQRVFAVQVFELHKLIKVQKLIAASPHLLIEGDPVLGSALGKKAKLPKGNLKVQTLSIANKDDIPPTPEQPELSKQNTEGNPHPPSPCHDDGLGGDRHDQAATNETCTSNPPVMPAAPDNKHNNWCMNPPQNQWLVPVMSPSEGLVYKPYAGPCPPIGSLMAPFYANCTPLRLPSTPYGVPMPHQPQNIAPPGAPAMHRNYFPPFSVPVMNPGAPVSAVEQGSHAAVPQPHGRAEQQSLISCNMSHPSGIWRFHASRDSEPQASSASSPFDRIQVQGDGSGLVSVFPSAPVQNAQPQPSSGSRDQQNHVIRVVPHNAQTASESAARIFRSIQMERGQNDP